MFDVSKIFSMDKILGSKTLVRSISKMTSKKIINFLNERRFEIVKVCISDSGKLELICKNKGSDSFLIIEERQILDSIGLPLYSYLEAVKRALSGNNPESDYLIFCEQENDIFFQIFENGEVSKEGFLCEELPVFISKNKDQISQKNSEIEGSVLLSQTEYKEAEILYRPPTLPEETN